MSARSSYVIWLFSGVRIKDCADCKIKARDATPPSIRLAKVSAPKKVFSAETLPEEVLQSSVPHLASAVVVILSALALSLKQEIDQLTVDLRTRPPLKHKLVLLIKRVLLPLLPHRSFKSSKQVTLHLAQVMT
jgi:hypothetical protein